MERPLSPDDVLSPRPSAGVMLKRGLRKRCPRCGGNGLYESWFRMRPRCPRCGYKFEREDGFFVGAWFVNFTVTEALVFVLVMVFVFVKNADAEASVIPIAVVGVVLSVVAPVLFYPYSRTIWAAIDLAMTPLELAEIIDAEDSLHAPEATTEPPRPDEPPAAADPAG
ncbi:MAG: hypothetical protein JWN46_3224 [Acidimicrobiales bacterium]|nr:hypothetical protein [Acidimicrobiales bacterium]